LSNPYIVIPSDGTPESEVKFAELMQDPYYASIHAIMNDVTNKIFLSPKVGLN
jgi:hypothetical protein